MVVRFMNEEIKLYLDKYQDDIIKLFFNLRQIIYDCIPKDIEEKMWAKLPTYYVGTSFVRLIPFKDHINIEAKAINNFKEKLEGYKVTPKGMLQLYINDEIPRDILLEVFKRTLG